MDLVPVTQTMRPCEGRASCPHVLLCHHLTSYTADPVAAGTSLGDPIEVGAALAVLMQKRTGGEPRRIEPQHLAWAACPLTFLAHSQ